MPLDYAPTHSSALAHAHAHAHMTMTHTHMDNQVSGCRYWPLMRGALYESILHLAISYLNLSVTLDAGPQAQEVRAVCVSE